MLDLDKSGRGAFDSLAKNTLALQARVTMVTLLNLRSLDSSLTYEQVLKFRSIFVAKRKRWRTCSLIFNFLLSIYRWRMSGGREEADIKQPKRRFGAAEISEYRASRPRTGLDEPIALAGGHDLC